MPKQTHVFRAELFQGGEGSIFRNSLLTPYQRCFVSHWIQLYEDNNNLPITLLPGPADACAPQGLVLLSAHLLVL